MTLRKVRRSTPAKVAPASMHHCESPDGSQCDWVCKESGDELYLEVFRETDEGIDPWFQVNFCPLCGWKARQLIEGTNGRANPPPTSTK